MKRVAFVLIVFFVMCFTIHVYLFIDFHDRYVSSVPEEQIRVIDSLNKEIRKEAEASHMVMGRQYSDTVYVPMSNMDIIIGLTEQIEEQCAIE